MINFLNSILDIEDKIIEVKFKDNEIYSFIMNNTIIEKNGNDEKKKNEIGKIDLMDLIRNALFIEVFELREKETNKGEGFEELLSIHFIELKKIEKLNKIEFIKNFPWILFFNEPNNDYFKDENTPLIFKNARKKLLKLSQDESFLSEYEQRKKDCTDMISAKEVGITEGIAKGTEKSKINIAIKMFINNMNRNDIKIFTELSDGKLDIIKNFLDNTDYKIKDLQSELNIDEEILIEICEKNNVEERKSKKRKIK